MREEGSLVDIDSRKRLPWPDEWGGARWFDDVDRLFHPFNTSWASLGHKIKPGYYMNFYQHAGFFLYWLKRPPRPANSYPHYNDLAHKDEDLEFSKFATILENHTPRGSAPPTDFVADSDINWFRYISANDDGRFQISVGAVINLDQWRLDRIKRLYDLGSKIPKFVPWCHRRDFHQDWVSDNESPRGFGRTDGDVVVPDYKPDFRS